MQLVLRRSLASAVVSEELSKLLADWLAWVDDGAQESNEQFCRWWSLCRTVEVSSGVRRGPMGIELSALFNADGLDTCYPFGEDAYDEAIAGEIMHLDENRVAWVRKVLAAEL